MGQQPHGSATQSHVSDTGAAAAAYLHSTALALNSPTARLNSVTEKTPPSLSSYSFLVVRQRVGVAQGTEGAKVRITADLIS